MVLQGTFNQPFGHGWAEWYSVLFFSRDMSIPFLSQSSRCGCRGFPKLQPRVRHRRRRVGAAPVKFGSIIFCFCTIHFLSLIDSFQPYPCTSKNQIWRDNKKRKENRNTLNFTWFLMINQTKAYFTKHSPFLVRLNHFQIFFFKIQLRAIQTALLAVYEVNQGYFDRVKPTLKLLLAS